MRFGTMCVAGALVLPGTATAQTAKATKIVVANQRSASASVLISDSSSAKHITVGDGPHEIAISRDGKIAVATIYGAQVPGNKLAVIDLARDSVVRTIDLGTYTRPHGAVFLSGNPKRVAVTSEATAFVVIVNVDNGTIEAAIPTQARASHMVALTADGKFGYTANIVDNNVSELDIPGGKFVRTIAVPARPEGIAVTPDGSEVWVGSNTTGAVSVISTKTGKIEHTLAGITFPYRITAGHKGKLMAIVDGQGNKVVFADVATHQISRTVDLASPRGVALSADDKLAFVTLAEGAVVVIDVAAGKVLRTLAVQASPDGVAVTN